MHYLKQNTQVYFTYLLNARHIKCSDFSFFMHNNTRDYFYMNGSKMYLLSQYTGSWLDPNFDHRAENTSIKNKTVYIVMMECEFAFDKEISGPIDLTQLLLLETIRRFYVSYVGIRNSNFCQSKSVTNRGFPKQIRKSFIDKQALRLDLVDITNMTHASSGEVTTAESYGEIKWRGKHSGMNTNFWYEYERLYFSRPSQYASVVLDLVP